MNFMGFPTRPTIFPHFFGERAHIYFKLLFISNSLSIFADTVNFIYGSRGRNTTQYLQLRITDQKIGYIM